MAIDLSARIDAARAEIRSARTSYVEEVETHQRTNRIERDREARKQYSAEQEAKSADIQATRELKDVEDIARSARENESEAARLARAGDPKADELREYARHERALLDATRDRAHQAQLDAAELRQEASTHGRRVTELEVEFDQRHQLNVQVEANLDKYEQQTALLEQAQAKFEFAAAAADPGSRARVEAEAEALLKQAEAIEVDRGAIHAVVPEFEETPAVAAAPMDLLEEEAAGVFTPPEDVSVAALEVGDDITGVEATSAAAETDGAPAEPTWDEQARITASETTDDGEPIPAPEADVWAASDSEVVAIDDWEPPSEPEIDADLEESTTAEVTDV